jgi:hypothetical protein
MESWIDVNVELPAVNRVVDVCVMFGSGGVTQLRGYRLASRTARGSLWLNSLTHALFPDAWRVVRWRHSAHASLEYGVLPIIAAAQRASGAAQP